MNLDQEIAHLRELMPASGRMSLKIVPTSQGSQVISTPTPKPWERKMRPIYLNMSLWEKLSRGQRDLVFLRLVAWSTTIPWLKPNWYQTLALVGVVGTVAQFTQGDAVGVVIAGGLSAIAVRQLWRNYRGTEREVEADEVALKVATRRGYNPPEAARNLLEGIQAVAELEGRSKLSFSELLRIQNLKTLA
ncbi:DUF3318 domain-containing protein [Spirulina subsalsa]|uniref:DUF3318 domain-containing protein n=1 Tax=Spirulina subsalsa TaxID=54311 RepID=UPI0002DC982C|nr:DUF3318 domain-containing protein [Spirulina subsalsa]